MGFGQWPVGVNEMTPNNGVKKREYGGTDLIKEGNLLPWRILEGGITATAMGDAGLPRECALRVAWYRDVRALTADCATILSQWVKQWAKYGSTDCSNPASRSNPCLRSAV